MRLSRITQRTYKTLSKCHVGLRAWSALEVTIEAQDLSNPRHCYRITLSKEELQAMLEKITERENEIKHTEAKRYMED